MKKIILLVCFALNLVFATSGAESTEVKASVQNSEFRTITDQLGREVKIPQNVEKIVVLQHQSLNLLVQLGAKDKITGVLESWEKNLGKNYARLFPKIAELATPGHLKVINHESVLALKPDVVITTNYIDKEQVEKLEKLGVSVVMMSFFVEGKKGENSVNPEFDDEEYSYNEGLKEGIKLLGDISGTSQKADELIKFIDNSQNTLKEKLANLTQKTTIYMANPDYTTYGSGKYTSIIFRRAGGENVAAKDIKGYKQVSPENIVAWNPDVIFVQERYPGVVDEIKNDKNLSGIKAVKEDKIYLMPEYAKAWGYPTPEAMALGEFWVAKKLYPELFADFDLDALVKDYYSKFYGFEYDGK